MTWRSPTMTAGVGALCIGSSATLVRLADVSAATAAVFRCLYALPVLACFAVLTRRSAPLGTREPQYGRGSHVGRGLGSRWPSILAGLFFALDMILFNKSIFAIGAGIATVLLNLQIIIVGAAGWLLFGERPRRRLAAILPIALIGVVLISGGAGGSSYGPAPVLGVLFGVGAALAYSSYLLALRAAVCREVGTTHSMLATTAGAAFFSALLGPLVGGIDLVPSWPAHGWLALLALAVQTLGWTLITSSLPSLPAVFTSLLLLLQPAFSMVLAAVVLGERPSADQLSGCVLLLAAVCYASYAPSKARASAERPTEAGAG